MLISVIIPCYNEGEYITTCLNSIIDLELSNEMQLQIIVVDGASTDQTKILALDFASKHKDVLVIDNPARKVSPGFNNALKYAKGEYIVRADCHAYYPKDYIVRLVRFHESYDAVNVGASLINRPGNITWAARAINAAMSSPFGVGISFRTAKGTDPILVDTVPFGCWRRETFEKYGMLDESFDRAQDLEFNTRCRLGGGKIFCLPDVRVEYFNRPDYSSFLRMVFQLGYWKHFVNKKHKVLSSTRQLAPLLFAIYVIIAVPSLIFFPKMIKNIFLFGGMIYLLLDFVASFTASLRVCKWSVPLILLRLIWLFPSMHFIYGWGLIQSMLSDLLGIKRLKMGESTR